MLPEIIFLNISIAAVMLLFTSYLDLKKREVPDKIWLISGGIGGVLQAYEITQGVSSLFAVLIAIALAAVIGMGIFFLGLYGGADGKALIAVAVILPTFRPHVGLYSIAPLIVLTNGVLLSMLLPLGLLILNASRILRHEKIFEGFSEPLHKKILASVLGYRSSGKPRDFQFSMEKTVNQGSIENKKFDFALMQEDFETKSDTWVTPGIPLLVFFTAGYFVLVTYGDLVISIIMFFAHSL